MDADRSTSAGAHGIRIRMRIRIRRLLGGTPPTEHRAPRFRVAFGNWKPDGQTNWHTITHTANTSATKQQRE